MQPPQSKPSVARIGQMSTKRHNFRRTGADAPHSRPAPKPLTSIRLEEMALAYVARFATTQGKLRSYLNRKLSERGWDESESDDPPVDALVARFADVGYVDDAAWAKMKAGSLSRRGYGARRVGEALRHAGIDEDVRNTMHPAEAQQRASALALARRRRFGPFSREAPDRLALDRQLAAMLRAGHSLALARQVLEAVDENAAQAWADELNESDGPDSMVRDEFPE